MLNPNFVVVGAFIFIFGSIGYFVETIQGKVKPNKVTWFIWALAPLITFFAEIKQGVGIQSLLPFMVGFIPFAVFLASFVNKKAYWKIGYLDLACGSLALTGLVLWQITKVGNIAIALSILSDLLAGLPTVIKSYREPETENYVLYLTNAIFAGITLLTIKVWSFEQFAFPLYIFLIALIIAILIKFKIGKLFK